MSKRSTIHLLASLTLLFAVFFVLPGVFIYRFGQQILTQPTDKPPTFSPQALKRFQQKELLLKKNLMVDQVTYTEEELLAGYLESFYKKGKKSMLDPDLEIRPSGITISATVYVFSIPVPAALTGFVQDRVRVTDGRIAFYSRITVRSRVLVQDRKPILKPDRIHIGDKEIPSELFFLGRMIIPPVFTQSLPDPIASVELHDGAITLYKIEPSEETY